MELIDRDSVRESVKEALVGKVFICEEELVRDIGRAIRDVPTIESRPKGKWIYDGETELYATCSNCKENLYQAIEYRFCPNCGSEMENE